MSDPNTIDAMGEAPHNGTETSKAAAESLAPETLGGLRAKVYNLIAARSWLAAVTGTTSDDVERILDMRHQTASARVHELAKAGIIVPNGKRLTRSGRLAVAYVSREYMAKKEAAK